MPEVAAEGRHRSCAICGRSFAKLNDHIRTAHKLGMVDYRSQYGDIAGTNPVAGFQPERDGRLQCLLCNRWYRSLGPHLHQTHDTNSDTYRERFQLPATLPLLAGDLRDQHAERAIVAVATNEAFKQARPTGDREQANLAKGRRRKAETEPRRGVQLSKQAAGAWLGERSRQHAEQLRAERDAQAAALGYRDLEHFLQDTAYLTHAAVGELLGWSAAKAAMWRTRHGITSTSQATAAAARARQQITPDSTPPPPAKPTQQPVDADGRLRCLECQITFLNLGKHVEMKHQFTAATYRRRHGLAADHPLMSKIAFAEHQQRMAKVGRSNLSGRSARVRAQHDASAQRAGYRDVVHLLTTCDNRTASEVLNVAYTRVTKIRGRYIPGQDGRRR